MVEFNPYPFGRDIFAQFGDIHAAPVVGNFDPPPVVAVEDPEVFFVDGTARELHMEYPLFTGDFVLHCHKLNHEDQGMMELVRIE